jgi:hypothetical protein
MNRAISVAAAALIAGLALSAATAVRVEAQQNECFVACGLVSKGCIAGLRGERSDCKLACRGIAPGAERGECKRACAKVPKGPKQECKIARDRCRSECDHPNACGFGCSADGRECFTMVRNASVECRMTCREMAETAAEACASDPEPEVCLEAVGEARGECLDECGSEQGAALQACGEAFEACKDACTPNDPNEPEPSDPNAP